MPRQDLQLWMQSFLAVSSSHIDVVSPLTVTVVAISELRAACQRVEGGNGRRRCTLPNISSFFSFVCLVTQQAPLPPTPWFFVSCWEASLKCTRCQITRTLRETLRSTRKQAVSSKLTRLRSGLLLFSLVFLWTQRSDCEHPNMEQSSAEGDEQSKSILRFSFMCSAEAICSFPQGNQCQSKSLAGKDLDPLTGKVALSPVPPETKLTLSLPTHKCKQIYHIFVVVALKDVTWMWNGILIQQHTQTHTHL